MTVLLPERAGPRTRLAAVLIGGHSCALGLVMLFGSGAVLPLAGFGPEPSLFFPSQSGVFLLALGICYMLAAVRPALFSVLIVSKALAVAFLVAHAALLDAPPVIWLAAAGDAAMLAAVLAGLALEPLEQAASRPEGLP